MCTCRTTKESELIARQSPVVRARKRIFRNSPRKHTNTSRETTPGSQGTETRCAHLIHRTAIRHTAKKPPVSRARKHKLIETCSNAVSHVAKQRPVVRARKQLNAFRRLNVLVAKQRP